MNIESFREYCLSKAGVSEGFPFDETTLVFKLMGKMFAITDTEDDFNIALKCDPERAIELRERYPAIQPGWHLNKQHWNTILIDDSLSDTLLIELIDHSYDLIRDKLTKKLKTELAELEKAK
jgi:predicted DNA-binding protein (MmcQ/YjbR family)